MLYHLFQLVHKYFRFHGDGILKYISFRASFAAIFSLLISIIFGKWLINWFEKRRIIENVRDLNLEGEALKKHTPTMGGLIIIVSIIVPTILFARLDNVYIILLLLSTLCMGSIGFIDDYIKVFKKDKKGLAGKFKLLGQIFLGVTVSITLYLHKDVVVRDINDSNITLNYEDETIGNCNYDVKSTKTTIPFFKRNELDYSKIIPFLNGKYTWIIYMLAITFIIMNVSNAANLTDGLDGLLAGTSAIMGATLAILAYLSGNFIFARYLNIMYIPNLGELVIFCTAFIGACIGFLWYNAYPAQIFMGDTGSLTLGSLIAVIAVMIRKELLIPLLCGVFVIENLSVALQVLYFKYTKKKYGIGKRIFKMSPIHHHYQMCGMHEVKVVARFLIIGIILAILTLVTLKLR